MNIVVLISGHGSNLQAMIDADIPIQAVISNQADAVGLTRAQQAGIPTHTIEHDIYDSRATFDAALQACTDTYQPDLVVLAGFMRILTSDFVQHFNGKLINIHPSLLPKYRGCHTHRRALEAGDTIHGATVHYVTETLDGGPIISQASLDIHQNETEASLKARIQRIEHQLYPQTIELIRCGRVQWAQDRVVFDGKCLASNGIMLNL